MTKKIFRNVGVIGAGAWGTALAQSFARTGLAVKLWAFERDVVDGINAAHLNDLYLPEVVLSDNITATNDLAEAFHCDAVVLVIPTQHIARTLEAVADKISPDTPILIASKGIEISTGRLISQIVGGLLPHNPLGVLSGPSFAIEVARNLPAALTLAMPSQHRDLAYALTEALSSVHFRLYAHDDMVGVQIGGAVKNVIAIACGIAYGKQMGDNARAAIQTRGLAEMVRLGVALGADPETFLGLSGLGDLTLTCNALQSRNFSLGVAIGQGARAADIVSQRSSVAEGYYTADAVVKLAQKLGIDMPICEAVYETLHKEQAIEHVIKNLLARPVNSERRT
jgi:glycerol-3-phosphate dehydrogenase (NAD(P)+)